MLLLQRAQRQQPGLRLLALAGQARFELEEGVGEGDVGFDQGLEGLLRGGDGGVGGARVVEEGGLEFGILEQVVQVCGVLLFQALGEPVGVDGWD